ncbi:transmembrane protein 8a [Plakobranchus ocellatus]|uniref:Transmembrane protein 8a n=1 Tax=Plakobranchus ocellatus TaxID=259542 RepID=A0AAV4A7D4_9GAST|nr:transmembrane protein 8a [Plakobranchus ocellatus]
MWDTDLHLSLTPLAVLSRSHVLSAALRLLVQCVFFTDVAGTSVWNMPWPVIGYKSYMSLKPMRIDAPAGLAYLNLSFSGIKTESSCPQEEIHIVVQNGGLPLVETADTSFPENFVRFPHRRIEVIIKPGQIAELTFARPPPGPWFVVGYIKYIDHAIKQKGLNPENKCAYLVMSMAKQSSAIETTQVLPTKELEATVDQLGSLFSFQVPPSTISFSLKVLSCNSAPCELSLKYLAFVNEESKTLVEDCNKTQCILRIASPALNEVHVVEIKSVVGKTGSNHSHTIAFKILVEECSPFISAFAPLSCGLTDPLDRIESAHDWTTMFGVVKSSSVSLVADLKAANVTAMPFTVVEPNDVGSSLKWQIRLVSHPSMNRSSTVQICGGLMYNKLPDTLMPQFNLCNADIPNAINVRDASKLSKTENMELKRYVPYPQAGQWHIVLQAHCFSEDGKTKKECVHGILVEMQLEIQACIDGECSGHGKCSFKNKGANLVAYSACQCYADFKGYACTDNSKAQSRTIQLAAAYLLTLSNLFFVPAIIIGLHRGFMLEAFVYGFTMFFSTFYHACDGIRLQRYRICIMKFDILQLADYFGSACSLWFTLISMARIKHREANSLLQITGVFGLFVGVIFDRGSICIVAVPMFVGLTVIAWSWGVKMYHSKRLYPSWRRYVFYLSPGVLLAVSGGALFAFFETTSNYKYIHSLWHMCISLSLLLLLPPKTIQQQKLSSIETNTEMSQISGVCWTRDVS